MSLPRFRIRTLMIAVALMSAAFWAAREIAGLPDRAKAYRGRAQLHADIARFYRSCAETQMASAPSNDRHAAEKAHRPNRAELIAEHQAALSALYARAARYPFLPLPALPPAPK